jgi:hypothetical protein
VFRSKNLNRDDTNSSEEMSREMKIDIVRKGTIKNIMKRLVIKVTSLCPNNYTYVSWVGEQMLCVVIVVLRSSSMKAVVVL